MGKIDLFFAKDASMKSPDLGKVENYTALPEGEPCHPLTPLVALIQNYFS